MPSVALASIAVVCPGRTTTGSALIDSIVTVPGPAQTKFVNAVSDGSSTPLATVSSHETTLSPPPAQFGPAGSGTTLISEFAPLVPLVPFVPLEPLVPLVPFRPLQTKPVEVTSDASRTPFRLLSGPARIFCPPAAQFAPAGSGTILISAGTPPVVFPAPFMPLHTFRTSSTSPGSRTWFQLRSWPLLMMMPPPGQACSGADSGETADITTALTPSSPATCTASREQPARTRPARRTGKRPRRYAFMMLPSLCCSARRHVQQSRTGSPPAAQYTNRPLARRGHATRCAGAGVTNITTGSKERV